MEHSVPYSTWKEYALSALRRTKRAPAEIIFVEGIFLSLFVDVKLERRTEKMKAECACASESVAVVAFLWVRARQVGEVDLDLLLLGERNGMVGEKERGRGSRREKEEEKSEAALWALRVSLSMG